MIKNVYFCPRYVAETTQFKSNQAVISITDLDQKNAIIQNAVHILRLQFLDLEQPIDHPKFQSNYLFNKEHAQILSDFVSNLHSNEKGIDTIIVHCEAGASRSAAVALFIHYFTNCDFKNIDMANFANKHVVKTLEDMHGIKIQIPPTPQMDDKIILLGKIF